MSITALGDISSPYSRCRLCSVWIARRMSPSDARISSASVASSHWTPSSAAMCCSRPIIAASGSGLKRNLAQREAMGGMSREM
jgi:hypothetical protein